MSEFLWAEGHLGWGIFTVLVSTGLWWLLSDIIWRFKNIAIRRLAAGMLAVWLIGVGLIILIYFLGNR